VIDAAGNEDTAVTSSVVVNVTPTLTVAANQTVDEGSPLTINLATFTDPGFTNSSAGTQETFAATIDWGDGATEPASVMVTQCGVGVLTSGVLSGQHAYADDGLYTVTITLTDDDLGQTTGKLSVMVNNMPPSLGPLPPISASEGELVDFSATFTDLGGLDTHTAIVNWGDGSSSAATVDQNSRTITAEHVYADNGDYTVTLSLSDDSNATGSTQTTAAIANIAPTRK
jgi:hypothetical protein